MLLLSLSFSSFSSVSLHSRLLCLCFNHACDLSTPRASSVVSSVSVFCLLCSRLLCMCRRAPLFALLYSHILWFYLCLCFIYSTRVFCTCDIVLLHLHRSTCVFCAYILSMPLLLILASILVVVRPSFRWLRYQYL